MSDLPYQAEYAKTGRASCKACKQKIDQGALRIAIMVQSAFHDGKQPNWHHEECFFKKKSPGSIGEIANYNKLTHEDQTKIKSQLGTSSGVIMPVEKGKKGKAAKRQQNETAVGLSNYSIEYSKSSRATCKHCDIKICKGEIRVSKTGYDPKYGEHPMWHHVKCFTEKRNEFLFFASGEDIPGFQSLSKEDQTMVKETIKSCKSDEVPVKKIKSEPKGKEEVKIEKELQKKIKDQNKSFHKYRKGIADIPKSSIDVFLKSNSQEMLKGREECLDHLADMLIFGALEPCPDCKGQLILDTFSYKCTGDLSEWSKCIYSTTSPKRVPVKIPLQVQDLPVLKKYVFKCSTRVFESEPPPAMVVVKKEEPENSQKQIPLPPLKNLQFFLYGTFKKPKEEVKNRILKMGGLVVSKLTDTLAAVVSSKKELEKMASRMQQIQENDIEVVEESFLDLIDPENGTVMKTLELIKENNIADWGSDPTKRVPQDVVDGKSVQKSGSNYVKSKSAIMKLKVEDGLAVDPDSGVADIAQVHQTRDGDKYSAVLTKTDVVAGKNSYYKLQVLTASLPKRFWLFRSWGRIGTPIGGKKLDIYPALHDAVSEFEYFFMERTKNAWEDRHQFVKKPEAYFPIDVDYHEDKLELQIDETCSLEIAVQNLIMMIFDINNMKKTLMEFELDTDKMPLGKISKKQIKSGYNVLSELLKYIEKGQANKNKIIDATNRFYTLIPHSFGTDNPPLLNTPEIIKNKTEMLDNLLEIEIAYSLLTTDGDSSVGKVEAHYRKLKAEISPVDKTADEFALIQEYMHNTHAATHSGYTLELQEVFKVVREGEEKRFKPFKKLHNRRLLWHGSRTMNFAGILSQGLRIAPPEAPVSGYMFGKGIYFADMVSKSGNYCCANHTNNIGLLLLSEVALGNMKECCNSEYVTALPISNHSVWGRGRTQPDPAQSRTIDGDVVVPLGTPVTTNLDTQLLYNEFIIYDVAQVNIKYLLQVKFNFTY